MLSARPSRRVNARLEPLAVDFHRVQVISQNHAPAVVRDGISSQKHQSSVELESASSSLVTEAALKPYRWRGRVWDQPEPWHADRGRTAQRKTPLRAVACIQCADNNLEVESGRRSERLNRFSRETERDPAVIRPPNKQSDATHGYVCSRRALGTVATYVRHPHATDEE